MQPITREKTAQSVFREPLRVLALLKDLEPVEANIYMYLQFVGKLGPEVRALLYEQDDQAMWLFGYWFGLMCRFEHIWWCGRRVRRDFTAILIWLQSRRLSERSGTEGLLWMERILDLEDSPSWPPKRPTPLKALCPDVASLIVEESCEERWKHETD